MIAQRQLAEPLGRRTAVSRPRLRTIPDRRARRRLGPFILVAAAVVGALVFGVVALQAMVAETSFRMQDLTRRGVELRQDQGELRLQIAELTSPPRISRQARKLGLYSPGMVRTLRVRSVKGERADGSVAAPSDGRTS